MGSVPPWELIECIEAVAGELRPAGALADTVAAGTHADPVVAGGTAGTHRRWVLCCGHCKDTKGCLGTGMNWLVHPWPPPYLFPLPSLPPFPFFLSPFPLFLFTPLF